MKLELFIAFRYLTRRKKAGFISIISLISVLGVAVGVMALIVVLAVMSGFDRELKSKIVGIQPHITVQAPDGVADHETLIAKIAALDLPKVKSITPYVNGQGIIRSDTNALGVVVKGLHSQSQDLQFLEKHLRGGILSFDVAEVTEKKKEEIRGGVILGYVLASQLSVYPGDYVQVISPALEKKGLFKSSAKTETFRG